MQKTICSIFFEPLVATRPFAKTPWQPDDRTRPGGFNQTFRIEPAEPGKYQLLVINDVYELQTNGSEQAFCTPVYGDILANCLVNEWRDNKLFSEYGRPGIFVCEGAEPTAEELAHAKFQQTGWCEAYINEAESNWTQGNRAAVQDIHRKCAKWLGRMNYEWVHKDGQVILTTCKFCTTRIDSAALICKECGKPQDLDKWLQAQKQMAEAEAALERFKQELRQQKPPLQANQAKQPVHA